MAVSDLYAGRILDALLRGIAFVPPTRPVVSLHTADPGKTGASEVDVLDVPAYTRIDPAAAGPIAAAWQVPANGETQNLFVIEFPVLHNINGENVTITHAGFWDQAGNFMFGEALDEQHTFKSVDLFQFRAGGLPIRVTT